jgi:hypothetical protein
MNEPPRELRLEPARLVRALAGIAILLTLAHIVLAVVKSATGHDTIHGLVPLFDLDNERNIPSFFAGSLFLLNAMLFAFAAKAPPHPTSPGTWRAFAWLFVFLAFDELFSVHETLTVPVRHALHARGLLFHAWVIVYLPAVALITLLFLPVWRRLERPARLRFAVAAATYLAGAVGIEMVGGAYAEAAGRRSLTYGLLVSLEESLEMAGLILLTHTLLGLLARKAGGPVVIVQDRD